MKKTLCIILALVLAVAFSACAQKEVVPAAQVGDIGEAAAKKAALAYAAVAEADASWLSCKRDTEDGRLVYEIEFLANAVEYDCTVDAASGTVLKFDQDSVSPTPAAQSGDIGEAAAKKAALAYAAVTEADASQLSCKRDTEDGRLVYEIEFRVGAVEYDCTVDAASGTVLKFDKD